MSKIMNWLARKFAVLRTCWSVGRGWKGKRDLFVIFWRLFIRKPRWDVTRFTSVPCRVGHLETMITVRHISGDAIILKEMFVEKDYRALEQLEFEPSVIYDVGANIGLAGVLLKGQFPRARVIGFEPAPAEHAIACRNYAALGLEPPFQIAIGNTNGLSRFFADFNYSGGQHLLDGNDGTGIEVQVRRLADFLREHSLPAPDLIKMDIEGAEELALRGMGERLREVRAVIMETHSPELHEACTRMLKDAGMTAIHDHARSATCRVLVMQRK